MSLESGTRIGPYEVTAQIGAGGMGEVYRARDTKLDRDVALKVLPEAFTDDPERLARFRREAQVLAALNHPNIAAIHGLEDSTDTLALVLELVPGPTLQDRIARGAIPLDEALPIAEQIAEALEAAHEQGIIHRDLKPANVKVRPDGTVKVLDFGLAKALTDVGSAGASAPATDADLAESPTMSMSAAATRAGFILGTAAYMSPEQAAGKPADRRSDIWAYGVVLWEMLTGQQLFTGESISHVLAAVLRADPDWETLPADTPPSIRRLLRRCLERHPRQRLSDAAMARLEIDEAADGPGAADRPGPPDPTVALWQRPAALAGGTLAALAIGAIGGLGLWELTHPDAKPGAVMRFTIQPPNDVPMSVQLGPRDLTISRDGTLIVYDGVPPNGNLPRLHVRRLDRSDAAPLRGAEIAMGPFVSPDGEWIGFISQPDPTALMRVSVLGGQPLAIAKAPSQVLGADWGRDDRIVFGTATGGLFRAAAAGGGAEPLTVPDTALGESNHAWPSIIPDRDAVLFVIASGPILRTGQLAVLDLSSGEVKRLGLAGVAPHYVDTGHLVYAADDGSVRAVGFDAASLEVSGSPVPLVDQIVVKEDGSADFSFSDDGTFLYVPVVDGGETAATRSLYWIDRQSRREQVVGAYADNYAGVALSPDGRQVAVSLLTTAGVGMATFDLARGTFNQLTSGAERVGNPIWTLDGRRIVYGAEREGAWGLFARNADGTGDAERLITAEDVSALSPWSWSPDGAWLLVRRRVGAFTDLGIVSMEGERAVTWLFNGERASRGAISPDGRWIAYASGRSGRNEVYVERFPQLGDRRVVSTSGGDRPRWSPDGQELFYVALEGTALLAVPVDTSGGAFHAGTPSVVFEGRTYQARDYSAYDVTSDAQRFLVIASAGNPVSASTGNVVGSPGDAFMSPPIEVVVNWIEELKARVPVP